MIRKGLWLIGIWLISAGIAGAQNGGIRFEQGTWQEIREKAQKEKKLIFADFYTDWCGPCLSMAEEVFPLMEVGNFYNRYFVNTKIDAEKGEGKKLREKYKIVSYPAFLFIDPRSEEIVHRSSSRQDAETFLFTGKSAVTPEWRSPYLEKEYTLGNRNRELLSVYMNYLASVYQREKLDVVIKEYVALPDFSLKQKSDWDVFVKHITGITTPQFQELIQNEDMYTSLFGPEQVEAKLYQEFNLSLDLQALEQSPDFRGKSFLMKKNQAENHLRNKEYEVAIPYLDALMADPGDFYEELCHYLKFTARSGLYGEHPDFWLKKCAEMAQYVAYNSGNRRDASIHYDYALILEKLIRRLPDAGIYFPASVADKPLNGAKEYSLRPSGLKQKPRKTPE